MIDMYKQIPFSPLTHITQSIGAGDTRIFVDNVSVFGEAPTFVSIYSIDPNIMGETVKVLFVGEDFIDVERGVEGENKSWAEYTNVARTIAARDINDMAANIKELDTGAQAASAAMDDIDARLTVAEGEITDINTELDNINADITNLNGKSHNLLNDLQGGNATERYHLTLSQSDIVDAAWTNKNDESLLVMRKDSPTNINTLVKPGVYQIYNLADAPALYGVLTVKNVQADGVVQYYVTQEFAEEAPTRGKIYTRAMYTGSGWSAWSLTTCPMEVIDIRARIPNTAPAGIQILAGGSANLCRRDNACTLSITGLPIKAIAGGASTFANIIPLGYRPPTLLVNMPCGGYSGALFTTYGGSGFIQINTDGAFTVGATSVPINSTESIYTTVSWVI